MSVHRSWLLIRRRLYEVVHEKHLWLQSFGWSLLRLFLQLYLFVFCCHWGCGVACQSCNLWVIFAICCSLRRILWKARVLHEPKLRSLVVIKELLVRLIGVKLVWRVEHHWLLWALHVVLETTPQIFRRAHTLGRKVWRWHLVLLLQELAVHTHVELLALAGGPINIEH